MVDGTENPGNEGPPPAIEHKKSDEERVAELEKIVAEIATIVLVQQEEIEEVTEEVETEKNDDSHGKSREHDAGHCTEKNTETAPKEDKPPVTTHPWFRRIGGD